MCMREVFVVLSVVLRCFFSLVLSDVCMEMSFCRILLGFRDIQKEKRHATCEFVNVER